jgi:hypothetical protein
MMTDLLTFVEQCRKWNGDQIAKQMVCKLQLISSIHAAQIWRRLRRSSGIHMQPTKENNYSLDYKWKAE